LKNEIRTEPDICRKLQFEVARRIRRLQFLLLEYRFFEDNEEGSALPLNLPWPFFPLSLMLPIVKSCALVLVRLPCYFVKIDAKIVGLWAVQEQHESLLVASLGVAKGYRRLGIGTRILVHVEAVARHMGKRWLEVDMLRKNIPAQRLYTKYGFSFIQDGRIHYIMRGRKPL
jgi:ribosomal protein S18 acetylase RimI-like enzyme